MNEAATDPTREEMILPLERHFGEAFRVRLRIAVVASLILNVFLWRAASGFVRKQVYHNYKPVEITRVIIDKQNRIVPKVVKKEEIKKRVAQVRHNIEKRVVHHEPPRPIRVAHKPPPPPPQGAHNKVILAKGPGPGANDHTALEGGNAQLGKAVEQQPGNAVENPVKPPPPEPVKPAPPPPPQPKPEPKPEPKAAPPPPPPQPEPKPEPKPEPPPAPKKKGPSRDAEPNDQVKPEIPDDLKKETFKSFVRVKVEVAEDGSFDVILRTSSGNPEIDRRVLEALKRWKWKPALKDGEPVKSTQLFKFEFEVD